MQNQEPVISSSANAGEALPTSSDSSDSIDLQNYLTQLYYLVLTLDSPILTETKKKLRKSITKIQGNSPRTPLQDVIFSLEVIFRVITAPTVISASEDFDQKT